MANQQCKQCIHKDVCAYAEHYDDAVKLYEDVRKEAGKYPWFKISIDCVKYENETYIRCMKGVSQ